MKMVGMGNMGETLRSHIRENVSKEKSRIITQDYPYRKMLPLEDTISMA